MTSETSFYSRHFRKHVATTIAAQLRAAWILYLHSSYATRVATDTLSYRVASPSKRPLRLPTKWNILSGSVPFAILISHFRQLLLLLLEILENVFKTIVQFLSPQRNSVTLKFNFNEARVSITMRAIIVKQRVVAEIILCMFFF